MGRYNFPYCMRGSSLMPLWLKSGKLLINASGQAITCDHCPCTGECPTTIATCSNTLLVYVPELFVESCYLDNGNYVNVRYTVPATTHTVTKVGLTWQKMVASRSGQYRICGPSDCSSGCGDFYTLDSNGESVLVTCSNGLWIVIWSFNRKQFTYTKAGWSRCPPGTYTEGIEVSIP